jgi:peroxiredoxin family protein
MMLDSIMKKNNIMSLPQLLDAAQEQGVRFIACTMSMQVMGITRRDLQARTNLEYGGVAAFVEAAHGSRMSLVF